VSPGDDQLQLDIGRQILQQVAAAAAKNKPS